MKNIITAFLLGLIFFTSCKKNKDSSSATTTQTTPATGSTLDLMRDSMYLYAKEDYYWNDAIPDYATFNPRSYTGTDDITALNNELYAISQLKINPATSKAYEYSGTVGHPKYSYIDEGQSATRLSAVTGDFGLGAEYYQVATNLVIRYVYPGSPAGLAGIKRGYQITAISGISNLTYDGGTNVAAVNTALFNSSTITMTLKRPDATTFTVTLNTAVYQVNPILATALVDEGNGKKMGYICFNSFVALTSTQSALDAAFASFVSAGVSDLTVDLRYNGGGYVNTSEYLADLIAPTSVGSSLMYTKFYNSILTSNSETLLKNQVRKNSSGQSYNYAQIDYSVAANQTKFAKKGALNLTRVFFIVTGSTASAAELTINNLRPYMNVQLIGQTTYGKPVGFFDININKYTMYIPEFESKNALGQGGYYTGMVPASTDYPGVIAGDDVSKDFGDATEASFAKAILFAKTGSYTSSTPVIESVPQPGVKTLSVADINNFTNFVTSRNFNGMIVTDPKLKN